MSASFVPDDVRKAAEPAPAHMWRDGKFVVPHRGTFPPERCYACDRSHGVSRRYVTLKFYPNVNILLALASLASPVSVSVHSEFSLDLASCLKHRLLPPLLTFLCVLGFFGGIIGFLAGIIQHSIPGMLTGIAVAIGGLLGMLFKPDVKFVRHEGPFVWISGYGKPFLENLEPWPGIERFR